MWQFMHSYGRFTLHFHPDSFHSTSDWREIAITAKRPICPWCVRSVYRATVDRVTSLDLSLIRPSIGCHLLWQFMHSNGRLKLHFHPDSLHLTSDWRDLAHIAKGPICPWFVRSVFRPTVDRVTSSDLWLLIPHNRLSPFVTIYAQLWPIYVAPYPDSFHLTTDRPDIANLAEGPICSRCMRSVYRRIVDRMTSSDL
jgi:hypothetical protein